MSLVIRITEEPETTETEQASQAVNSLGQAEVNWDQEVERLAAQIQVPRGGIGFEKTPEQRRANERESLVYALHKADQVLQGLRYLSALQILEILDREGYDRSQHALNAYLNDRVEMAQGLQTPVLTLNIGLLMVQVGEDFCATADVPAPVAELQDWLRRNAR